MWAPCIERVREVAREKAEGLSQDPGCLVRVTVSNLLLGVGSYGRLSAKDDRMRLVF